MDKLEDQARSTRGYQAANGIKCPECGFVGKNGLALNGHKHVHSHTKKPEYQKITLTMKQYIEVATGARDRYIKNLMENKAYVVFWLNGDGKTLGHKATDNPAQHRWQ